MTEKERREAQAMGLLYVQADQAQPIWSGRKRMETPERLTPLPSPVPIYEHEHDGHPDALRVSFEDGSTAVYEIRRDQPHPATVKSIEIIRKWNNGYNNQPMRRRKKP